MYLEAYRYMFYEDSWRDKANNYMIPITVYTDAHAVDDKGAFDISIVPEEWATKGQWVKRVARLILSRREAKELGELLLKLE